MQILQRKAVLSSIVLLAVLSVTVLPAVAKPAGAPPQESERYLAFFGGTPFHEDALHRGGGQLVSRLDALGIAVIEAPAGASILKNPGAAGLRFVELDGRVSAMDTNTEGVTEERATWERATWESTDEERATWERATWEGADGERATWEASTSDPGFAYQWGLQAVDAPAAWAYENPAAAPLVCVPDSGVDLDHPDLASRIAAPGWDFVNGRPGAMDDAGHGTHVAGIIAAVRDNGIGIAGVSSARILPAKILDATGTGRTSDLVQALVWCADQGADVILLALREDAPTQALRRAAQYAQDQGALLVAAAGNVGPCTNCVVHPAAYPGVLAVGAIGPDGNLAAFSATGPQVDLVAPGVRIVSTIHGGEYAWASGTSMAAAFAAGVAALAWSADPDASAQDVARALCTGTLQRDRPGHSQVYGWGLVHAPGALLGLQREGGPC